MISQEKTMLYLTDFPFPITVAEVKDFLSKYSDSIIMINLDQNPKNKDKRKAMKVLFKDFESANKCRKEMNLQKIKNKSIRIMWDERDSSITHNTKNNLFFKGIPKSVTPRQVYEYFMQFGDISSCKMTEDDNGNHYGYGYITYYNSDDAKKAIENSKDKKIFESNILEVTYFQKRNERIINSAELNNQKIYISNLPEKCTTAHLTDLCAEYGEVKSCNIFIDNLGKSFGIVLFSSEKEAKDVLEKLDGKEINGVKLSVKLYQTKFEHKQYLENTTQRLKEQNYNCNLHIRNIPLTAKEEDLIKIFSKYGKVTSCRIEKIKADKKEKENDNTKIELISKGFGYVSFDNAESAKNAIEALNGKYLPGFESWSHTLIIELFMTKYERQFIDSNDNELSALSYFTYQNEQKHYSNTINAPPVLQMYPTQFFQIPMNNYSQYNNQYNQFGQFPQLRLFPNQRFNYPQMNNNQFINYNNNNFGYGNYGFRGQRFQRGYHRNNRNNNYHNNYNSNTYNNNYNKPYQQKKNDGDKKNKIDLSNYYKLSSEEEKKEFLGEKIFEAIQNSSIINSKNIDVETIGKITGMILELGKHREIIEVLENPSILNSRIEEALGLLNWKP